MYRTIRPPHHSRLAHFFVLSLAVAGVVSGCGSSSPSSPANAATTLNTAQFAPIEQQQGGTLLDPAFFYYSEGLMITDSAYEGLVQYQTNPPSTQIVPALATSWTVSSDSKMYTFTLRKNVRFATGSVMTSQAVAVSFKRFLTLNGGPAYMLANVASFATPDPDTFVIKLKSPESPLFDYLASPYGPKVIDPAVIKAHTKGHDQADKWLATHTAGTGAYQISQYVTNQSYTMTANPYYWGGRPSIHTLHFEVLTNPATRLLELRSGQLQLLRLDNPSDYKQLSSTPGIQTFTEPSSNLQVLFVSPVVPPFNTLTMRQALRAAIDRPALVTKVWGPLATPSTQILQAGLLPNGAAPDPIQYDPTVLKKAVAQLPSTERSLTLAYNSGALPDERMGEALAAVLSAAGLHVNLQAEGSNAWWKPHPPSLFINLGNSDTSNADTWLRPYATTKGGLNPLQVGSPAVDKFVNLGFVSPTQTAAIANYAAAARALEATATVITLAGVADAWAATVKFHGWSAAPAFPASLFVNKATLG